MIEQKVIAIEVETLRDLPAYSNEFDAGADVKAYLPDTEEIRLGFMERITVPLGFKVDIPKGYEIQVRPRSGLASNHGIMVVNSPGTIDSQYKDEVKVILLNTSHTPFYITDGMRIGQFVVAPVTHGDFIKVDSIDKTDDRGGGFGSSGLM